MSVHGTIHYKPCNDEIGRLLHRKFFKWNLFLKENSENFAQSSSVHFPKVYPTPSWCHPLKNVQILRLRPYLNWLYHRWGRHWVVEQVLRGLIKGGRVSDGFDAPLPGEPHVHQELNRLGVGLGNHGCWHRGRSRCGHQLRLRKSHLLQECSPFLSQRGDAKKFA